MSRPGHKYGMPMFNTLFLEYFFAVSLGDEFTFIHEENAYVVALKRPTAMTNWIRTQYRITVM